MNINTSLTGNISQRKRIDKLKNPSLSHPPSSSPSFKSGAAATIISAADDKVISVFSQHYGDIATNVARKLGKLAVTDNSKNSTKLVDNAMNSLLRKTANSRFDVAKGITSIKPKKFTTALAENAVFPFVTMPLYAGSWVLDKLRNGKIVPKAVQKKAGDLYRTSLLRVPRKINEIDAKTNIISGMYEKTKLTILDFAKQKSGDKVFKEFIAQYDDKVLENLKSANDDVAKVAKDKLIEILSPFLGAEQKQASTPQGQKLMKEANDFVKESLYKVSNKFFDKNTGNFNTVHERPLNRIVTGLIPVAFLANDAYNLSVLCGDKKETSTKEANERAKQEISRVLTTAYIQLMTFGAFTKQVNTIPWFTPLTSAATVLFSETNSRRRLGKPIFFLSKEKAKEYNQKRAENKDSTDKKTKKSKAVAATPVRKMDNLLTTSNSEPTIFTSFKAAEQNKPAEQTNKSENKKEEVKDQPKKALINFSTLKKAVGISLAACFTVSFLKNSSYTKNTKVVKGLKNVGKFFKEKVYNPLAFKDFAMKTDDFAKVMGSLDDVNAGKVAEGHRFIKDKYGEVVDGVIKMYKGKFDSSKIPSVVDTAVKEAGITLQGGNLEKVKEAVKLAVDAEKTSIAEMKFDKVAQKAKQIIKNKKLLDGDDLSSLTEKLSETIRANSGKSAIQVETKAKPFVDIVIQPFKFILSAVQLPFNIVTRFISLGTGGIKKKANDLALGLSDKQLTGFEKAVHKVVTEIYGVDAAKEGKISQKIFTNAVEQLEKRTRPYRSALAKVAQEKTPETEALLKRETTKLAKYVNTAVEKSFNGVTQSSNKNTDLAMMTKLASSAVTSAFLVADNYNMVMIKSNGEDVQGAKETANERIVQRLSALFYQSLFINWFNSTFKSTYNSSLRGMTSVAIPNTLTTEVLTRKSIGMPLGRKTFEQLQENEEKNENRSGFAGKYFRFMRLLTGKKPLKDRMPKDKKDSIAKTTTVVQPQNLLVANTQANTSGVSSTNLLERLSVKQ